MSTIDLRRPRLGHDAAAQPQAPRPLPVADADDHRDAGGVPAAVRLRLRRHHGRRPARRDGSADPRADYLHYITPAILVMTVVSVANSTAILVAKDSTEGIIDRFRTMPIARSAPLTGHVLAAMVQTVFAVVVVLVDRARARATAAAPRSQGGPAPSRMLLLMGWAVTWLCVALGPGQRQRRGRQQRPDAADPAAVPRPAPSCRPTRCRPGWPGSPSTSPSPRSSRRSAPASRDAIRAPTPGGRSAGAC